MKNDRYFSAIKAIRTIISLLLVLALFWGMYPLSMIKAHASESEFSGETETLPQDDEQYIEDIAQENIQNTQPLQPEAVDPVEQDGSTENGTFEQKTEGAETSEFVSEGLDSDSENDFTQKQTPDDITDFENDSNEFESFENTGIKDEQSSLGTVQEEPGDISKEEDDREDNSIDENNNSFDWDWEDHIQQEEPVPSDESKEGLPTQEAETSETDFEPVVDASSQDETKSENYLFEESEEQQVITDFQNSYSESGEDTLQIKSTIIKVVAGESTLIGVDSSNSSIKSAKSSNPLIADVESINREGGEDYVSIIGKKPGKAVISIIEKNGNITKKTIQVLSIFKNKSVSIAVGYGREIELRVSDSPYYYDSIYSITSSNPKVVQASIDPYASPAIVDIEGLGLGRATLTIKHKQTGATSQINVTVIKPPFTLDKSYFTLRASNIQYLTASGSNIKRATSSNTKVVRTELMSDGSVKLIPVKPGSTTVTVINQYGTARKASVKILSFLKFKTITVTAGKNRSVSYEKFYNADDYYNWTTVFSSHNKNVATAYKTDYWDTFEEKIVFKGLKPGKTAVYVKCGKTGAICPVTVNVKSPAFNLKSSKVTVKTNSDCDVSTSGSKIGLISCSHSDIVTAKKINDNRLRIIPVKSGRATITVSSIYGVKRQLTVVVAKSYFKQALTNKTKLNPVMYGETVLTGSTAAFSSVSSIIGGKTYSTTADAEENFSIKNVPFVKIGTPIKVTFKMEGYSISRTITVTKGKTTLYTPNYTYKDTTSVPVEITNVHSGDKLKITINGRSFYRTIKQSYSKLTAAVAIKKTNKYGIKMVVKLLNKFDQELATYNDYVYHSNIVHVGDTKAKVRWLTGWNDPVRKEYYSYGETWCYDWDDEEGEDAFLYFDSDGKVTDWYIYD